MVVFSGPAHHFQLLILLGDHILPLLFEFEDLDFEIREFVGLPFEFSCAVLDFFLEFPFFVLEFVVLLFEGQEIEGQFLVFFSVIQILLHVNILLIEQLTLAFMEFSVDFTLFSLDFCKLITQNLKLELFFAVFFKENLLFLFEVVALVLRVLQL